jgi:hypothetical protein
MQFYPHQTQLSTSKLTAIFILVLGFVFVHFDPQLINKLLFFYLASDLVNFSLNSRTFFSFVLGFGFLQSNL